MSPAFLEVVGDAGSGDIAVNLDEAAPQHLACRAFLRGALLEVDFLGSGGFGLLRLQLHLRGRKTLQPLLGTMEYLP